MKTMMKKCGIYAAFAAVVLVMAALVTGCSTPETPAGGEEEQLPEGMGGVTVSFADTVEQRATILPGTIALTNFSGGFKLQFTATSGGASKDVQITSASGTYPTIALVPGTYTLDVSAYLDTYGGKIGASYLQTGITVAAGGNVNITIALQAIATGSGKGKFAWSIASTLISYEFITKAEMTLTPIAGIAITPATDLKDNLENSPATGDMELDVGYYYVDFELELTDDKGTVMTNNFRHILHVYQNMTSTFNYAFTNASFSIATGKISSITYTPPSDLVPTFTAASASSSSNTISGSGTLTSPWKVSKSDTTFPDKLAITVGNAGSFTTFVGTLGADGTKSVTFSSSPFNLDFTSSPLSTLTSRGYPYQFIVTGTAGGKPYQSAEYFITVTD